jgi:hypothetical protein
VRRRLRVCTYSWSASACVSADAASSVIFETTCFHPPVLPACRVLTVRYSVAQLLPRCPPAVLPACRVLTARYSVAQLLPSARLGPSECREY